MPVHTAESAAADADLDIDRHIIAYQIVHQNALISAMIKSEGVAWSQLRMPPALDLPRPAIQARPLAPGFRDTAPFTEDDVAEMRQFIAHPPARPRRPPRAIPGDDR